VINHQVWNAMNPSSALNVTVVTASATNKDVGKDEERMQQNMSIVMISSTAHHQ